MSNKPNKIYSQANISAQQEKSRPSTNSTYYPGKTLPMRLVNSFDGFLRWQTPSSTSVTPTPIDNPSHDHATTLALLTPVVGRDNTLYTYKNILKFMCSQQRIPPT